VANQNLIADRFEQAKASDQPGKGTIARVAGWGPAKPGASESGIHPPIMIDRRSFYRSRRRISGHGDASPGPLYDDPLTGHNS
jgi:hypothetical protein